MLGTKNTLFINPSALRMSPIVVQDCPSKQTAIIFMSLAVPLWKRDHIWACWLLVVPHRRRDGKGHGRTVTSFSHSYQPVACSSYLIACNLRERLEWIGWGGLGRRLHLMAIRELSFILGTDLAVWLPWWYSCSQPYPSPTALKESLINLMVLQSYYWWMCTSVCPWDLRRRGRHCLPPGRNFSNLSRWKWGAAINTQG